ncbi:DUF2157 domain-containing protein [Cronbergia sp. UHCC 0137]|uniref:DUF2157 domain-containing protein n=1 Tax=Cronbergia sp. UHCC 0137 TaxID=3110239 RepID=UPI002B2099A8|nr:DUF2157 domain-containing protein [Cronbergia sp. UHCC 0137]MEA5618337.1 DUF2157 domain-containing protein [Cronbergia sp. UHCC 0137]
MSSPVLKFEVRLPGSHPRLLEGLDLWLRLGLISDAQVRQICREFLVCSVVVQTQDDLELEPVVLFPPQKPLVATLPQRVEAPVTPNFFTSIFQSLGEELSVRWLLFLGVFLVVVSSGVLAGSQWESFPASGQYGVLLAYTLCFWGLSFWAGRQSNLSLTAQTLLIVTLLLVPVNFWAMDSFGLWRNPFDWLMIAIASPILSFITYSFSKNHNFISSFPRGKLPLVINILFLSYLHWGWKISNFPLIAVYLAMIGTTIITIYQYRIPSVREDQQGLNWFSGVIVYALFVLLVRAIFIVQVDVTKLGLAIGICGWLITWLADQTPQPKSLLWERIGGIFLFLGWLVAVTDQPWQAIVISGLVLWFCYRRLQRYDVNFDLLAFFLTGLQTIFLGWRLLPSQFKELAITTATNLTNSQNTPWTLLGVVLFPYLIVMVVLTESLYRQEKPNLANFGDALNLLFGIVLAMLAFINPTTRSLNLLLSTITLSTVTKYRSFHPLYVYLTHITGLLTVFSTIYWWFPNLSQEVWAAILLTLMVGEWLFSLGEGIWRRTAWPIGIWLATVSFLLLWGKSQTFWNGYLDDQDYWRTLWLITPITLTFLGNRTTGTQRKTRIFLSVLTILSAQLLTLPLILTKFIGLGVGLGVMLINTQSLRYPALAGTTVGFGLSLIAALLWEIFPNLGLSGWFVVGGLTILGLWLGRTVLLQRSGELTSIYAASFDQWAIALCNVELIGITLHSLLVYQQNYPSSIGYFTAITITLAAILYRSWRQPNDFAFYGIGWCLELLAVELLGFTERSIISITIANIALGLITQLFGEWWKRKFQLTSLPSSLNLLPLFYAGFSILLRINTFTNWTGFCSLGVALIMIGVGRRSTKFKSLLYFGIIGVSISAYEILFYQLTQSPAADFGDRLIAMSALGVSIMYAYRILSPWLGEYLLLTPLELRNIAHLHWVWSSSLFLAAIYFPININIYLALGTGAFLTRYAIWQGRTNSVNPSTKIEEIWVYLGLATAWITGIYLQYTPIAFLFTGQLRSWHGAIACVVSYFFYILPWESWGWSKKPWQRAAYILPLIIIWQTQLEIYPITLIITAGFYIFLSKVANQLRLSYVSMVLVDWALWRWFTDLQLRDSLWYITPIGLSILYVAQVDNQLKLPESKEIRHSLRLFGSGLICGWAVIFQQDAAWIPGIFSLIAIFSGLVLRVRAFLYIGTATFLTTSIYQLVIFSLRHSFVKWIVGLLVGILLISIAAHFETRRTQISSLLRNTTNELQNWE